MINATKGSTVADEESATEATLQREKLEKSFFDMAVESFFES